MPANATATLNLAAAVNATPVTFWDNPIILATWLASLTGPQFMAFDARYNMDEDSRMVQKDRVTKLPNPYLGRGLVKESTTQVTVNFNYEAKVEARGGEYSGKGSWHTAVLVNGKPSPLSVHSKDITVAPDGTQTFVENPRLYLRYEIVAVGDAEKREDKELRSKSRYVLPDGTEVDKKEIEPYLKAYTPRTDETNVQTTGLGNIVELRAAGRVWRRFQPAAV